MSKPYIISVWDNEGESIDRYTIVLNTKSDDEHHECFSANHAPQHPQGFGQHGTCKVGPHLGKQIDYMQLPVDVRKCLWELDYQRHYTHMDSITLEKVKEDLKTLLRDLEQAASDDMVHTDTHENINASIETLMRIAETLGLDITED